MRKLGFVILLLPALLQGCMSAGAHRAAVADDTKDRLTVGAVQREIVVGMAAADVASVLGSPNIDEQRREVWIYDKFSTEVTYSQSSGGVSALILGAGPVGSGGLGGGVGAGASRGAGASSKTQRTLTVIIKFDENKKVRDFAYHTSSF